MAPLHHSDTVTQMSRIDYVNGALAGIAATIFHTAVMFVLRPRLPRTRREPLPPLEITSEIAGRAGLDSVRHGAGLRVATVASHFGFGGVAGALYAPIGARLRRKRTLVGIGYGIAVWTVSYLGWIPALRILAPATQHSAQRNTMMILAHVAWGAALAVIYRGLSANTDPESPARRSTRTTGTGRA